MTVISSLDLHTRLISCLAFVFIGASLSVPAVLKGNGARWRLNVLARLDRWKIHYQSHGKGDDAIVLIHGWVAIWNSGRTCRASKKRRKRVLALSLPGTARVTALRPAYSIDF